MLDLPMKQCALADNLSLSNHNNTKGWLHWLVNIKYSLIAFNENWMKSIVKGWSLISTCTADDRYSGNRSWVRKYITHLLGCMCKPCIPTLCVIWTLAHLYCLEPPPPPLLRVISPVPMYLLIIISIPSHIPCCHQTRLLSTKAQGHKVFWKPFKPHHVGIQCWLSLSTLRWVPMCQAFNHFSGFLQDFVLDKLATSSIYKG